MPFTPAAKDALETSLHEALGLHDSSITEEHVLLGLLSSQGAPAARLLVQLGVDPGDVRRSVLWLRRGAA